MSKVLIIGGSNHSNKRIQEELLKKGVPSVIRKSEKFTLYLSDALGHDRCSYNGKRIFSKDVLAIIPRIGKNFRYGVSIVEHLNENMKIYSPSTCQGLKNASDKYLCSQILSKSRLQVPKTVYFKHPTYYSNLIDLAGGYPVVAKLLTGSQGSGVFILNDDLSGKTALSTISGKFSVLLQQYIETATKDDDRKCDIRAWVVGNKVVASMKRFSSDSDFRSNYSITKTAEPITLTEDQKQFAINCSKSLGLEFSGVDLMIDEKSGKTYCIEVNGNASLVGIEKVTGINVAGEIANHIYSKVSSKINTDDANSLFNDEGIHPLYDPNIDSPTIEVPTIEKGDPLWGDDNDNGDNEDDEDDELEDGDYEPNTVGNMSTAWMSNPINQKAVMIQRNAQRAYDIANNIPLNGDSKFVKSFKKIGINIR